MSDLLTTPVISFASQTKERLIARRVAVRRRKRLVVAAVVAALVAMAAGSAVATATGLLVYANGDIAFAHGGDLLGVNPELGRVRRIWRCPKPNCSIFFPSWSPSGRRLAFVQGQFGGPDPRTSHMSLYVMAVGGKPRRLASCGDCGRGWGTQLSWSPNGKWIAYNHFAVRSPDRRRGEVTPELQETIWIVPAAGGKPHPVTRCRGDCIDVHPSWSPNGRFLVYERRLVSGGNPGITYTVRRDGSHRTAIANGVDTQWSPDGRRIAFEDGRGIEVADADGSNMRLLYPQTGGNGPGVPSWSPDGKKLVFFNTPDGPNFKAEVWTINADGSAAQRLYHSGCCVGGWAAPIWSPDGRKIAFGADTAGGTYVMNADGSGLKQLSPIVAVSADPSSMSWQRLPERAQH